jgi:hypothetical protein
MSLSEKLPDKESQSSASVDDFDTYEDRQLLWKIDLRYILINYFFPNSPNLLSLKTNSHPDPLVPAEFP